MRRFLKYFSKGEWILWISSLVLIVAFFCIFDRSNYLSLIASLIGATSLIFNAKGNPLGQVLIIIFAILYGIISWTCAYYGEMITYLGMSLPMAVIALISWLRNPHNGNKAEVSVNRLNFKEVLFMLGLSAIVTVGFYFILKHFNTANLIPSTLSITTSFIAAYLTFRRSPFYAFAYALNDLVLIVLWVMATIDNISYISVIACFVIFLVNDLYGFFNWLKMEKRQKNS
ncbi:MAG: nicotinamide mononucleotide transporter [Clostridia bacterium]|nr:nicotinamide mononucleotide transporter [Clostridia bacterium]